MSVIEIQDCVVEATVSTLLVPGSVNVLQVMS